MSDTPGLVEELRNSAAHHRDIARETHNPAAWYQDAEMLEHAADTITDLRTALERAKRICERTDLLDGERIQLIRQALTRIHEPNGGKP